MKLNTAKCHLFISGHKFEHVWINVGGVKVRDADSVIMLGVSINNNLITSQTFVKMQEKNFRL